MGRGIPGSLQYELRLISAAAAAGALFLCASAASAMTSFTLDINTNSNGTPDTPLFTLTNTSDSAFLTSFSLNFAPSPDNIDRAISFTRLNDGTPQLQYTVHEPGPVRWRRPHRTACS